MRALPSASRSLPLFRYGRIVTGWPFRTRNNPLQSTNCAMEVWEVTSGTERLRNLSMSSCSRTCHRSSSSLIAPWWTAARSREAPLQVSALHCCLLAGDALVRTEFRDLTSWLVKLWTCVCWASIGGNHFKWVWDIFILNKDLRNWQKIYTYTIFKIFFLDLSIEN